MPNIVLQDLLTTAEHATLVLTADQKIVAFNNLAREMLAPDLSVLEGRSLPDICTGRLLRFYNLVTSAMESGEPVANFDIAMGNAACKMDICRGGTYWVVRIRDVTEQLANLYKLREAEAEKEEMRELMMTALNGISVGVVVSDVTGRPVYVNRFARKFIGDVMERAPTEDYASALGMFEPDEVTPLPDHKRFVPRALAGETVMQQEFVLKNSLTERGLHILGNIAPFFNRSGEISGAVGWYYLLDQLSEGVEPIRPEDGAKVIDVIFRQGGLKRA